MVGRELYEARRCELQLLNAIRFASPAPSSTLLLYSADGATVIHQPKLEESIQDVPLESGEYPHHVTFKAR